MQVGYPLVTLLLCLGDPHIFKESFSGHLDLLYKLLKVVFGLFLCNLCLWCHSGMGFNTYRSY